MYNFAITILAFGLTLSNSAILAQTTSSDNTQDKPWIPQNLTPVPPHKRNFYDGGNFRKGCSPCSCSRYEKNYANFHSIYMALDQMELIPM